MIDRRADRRRVAELLDFQEGRLGVRLLHDAQIQDLLRSGPRIAVIGASNSPIRPSHGVLIALRRAGYDVVPVNPAERVVDGRPCFPTLREAVAATGPVDIVDVFRRYEACPAHAREAVEVDAHCLWLQLGIVNREAGQIAAAAGLSIVMNRCTIVEHDRLVRT